MNKNLINILRTFSKAEWKRFRFYLESNYFIRSRDYSEIFSIISKHLQSNKNPDELTKDFFSNKLKKKFSNQTLMNRLSEISKHAEQFLVTELIKEKPILYNKLLYKNLIERNLYSNFISNYSTQRKKLEPKDSEDLTDYCDILLAEGLYCRNNGDFEGMFKCYEKQSEYYTAYFMDKTISIATDYELMKPLKFDNNFKIFNNYISSLDLSKAISLLEKKQNENFKFIILRYKMYCFFRSEYNDKGFENIISYFEENAHLFSVPFKTEYYLKMQSYMIHLYNTKVIQNIKPVFEIILSRFKDKDTMDFSRLSYPATEFRDFVSIGLMAKEPDWVEKLIKQYHKQLPEAIRRDEYVFAMIKLYFYRKDFLKAIYLIEKKKPGNNHIHNLDLLRNSIKINYELGRFDKADYNGYKLSLYLKKKGIEEGHRAAAKCFLKNFKKLTKLSLLKKKSTIDKSLEKFKQGLYGSAEIAWLIKKAEELKESK